MMMIVAVNLTTNYAERLEMIAIGTVIALVAWLIIKIIICIK